MKKNKSPIESHRSQLNRDNSSGSEECVFGMHTVVEAIESGRGNKLFLQDDSKGSNVQTLKELAQEHGVPVKWVPKEKLNLLSDNAKHQGIVLMVSPYHYFELNDLLDKVSSETKNPFLLILDSIEDPHNFGSILRTADATGVSGVIIPKHRSVGITGVVAKTSTGAVEHIPVARVNNLNQAVATLKERGYWIYGTDLKGNDFRTWKTDGSIALIIGNEGRGMSSLLKREVDELLTIPMQGHVQSLNASVAAGLLMYEVLRTRNPLSK